METEDVNLEAMTEEEQIEYAMKMSMADQAQEVCTFYDFFALPINNKQTYELRNRKTKKWM